MIIDSENIKCGPKIVLTRYLQISKEIQNDKGIESVLEAVMHQCIYFGMLHYESIYNTQSAHKYNGYADTSYLNLLDKF